MVKTNAIISVCVLTFPNDAVDVDVAVVVFAFSGSLGDHMRSYVLPEACTYETGRELTGTEGTHTHRGTHQFPKPSCSTASSSKTSSIAPQSSTSKGKLPSSYTYIIQHTCTTDHILITHYQLVRMVPLMAASHRPRAEALYTHYIHVCCVITYSIPHKLYKSYTYLQAKVKVRATSTLQPECDVTATVGAVIALGVICNMTHELPDTHRQGEHNLGVYTVTYRPPF